MYVQHDLGYVLVEMLGNATTIDTLHEATAWKWSTHRQALIPLETDLLASVHSTAGEPTAGFEILEHHQDDLG